MSVKPLVRDRGVAMECMDLSPVGELTNDE
jgi:hypothetical protein